MLERKAKSSTPIQGGSFPFPQYVTRLERLARDEHLSLLALFVRYQENEVS